MTTKALLKTTVILTALIPSVAFGLGIRVVDHDAFATARGNAFTATANTPAAIYFNPAGITQIKQPALSGGFYALFFDVEYKAPDGTKHKNEAQFQHVPHIYFTLPIRTTPFTFGYSVHVPFGLRNDWPDDTNFSAIATRSEVPYIRHNPVLAWEINPKFSIAAGLTMNDAEAKLRRIDPNFGEVRTELRDQTLGYVLAAHWQPTERHAFGATYHSRTDFDLKGSVAVAGMEPDAKAEFPFPEVVMLGYSYRPTPAWNFEVNLDWTNWDILKTVTVEIDDPNFNDEDMEFNWKSSFVYKAGVTRFFDNGYRVSLGYMFSENSIPNQYFNPAIPEYDRHLATTGIGYSYDWISWDLAYELGYSPTRRVRGSPFGLADGDYRAVVHGFVGTMSFYF